VTDTKSTKVVVIGAGGFGREVMEILKAQNELQNRWQILGFLDDNGELQNKTINRFRILGGISWLSERQDEGIKCVCAIGDTTTRKKVVNKITKEGGQFCQAIHPTVIASETAEIGEGAIICAGSILTVNLSIDDHCIINLNCTIGHDAMIEKFCTLNPTVSINGHDTLEEGVYIGSGATLIEGVRVGRWTTVGAGAVVVDDIPSGVVAVGVPARPIRSKKSEEVPFLHSPEQLHD